MKKIRKVVIPAAGFGTRFLPQTKAMPKEMLPIVDKPVIQYVVEEAVASGIEDIVIVTGALKRAIEDHFDVPNADLIQNLQASGKEKLLMETRRISELANFIYIQPLSLYQMMKVNEKYGGAVISAVRIKKRDDRKRYGIADVEPVDGNVFKIKKIIEKPHPDIAPSNLATHGAYILPPEIFDILRNQKPGTGGEIYLPEAIDELIKTGYPVYACEIENGKY